VTDGALHPREDPQRYSGHGDEDWTAHTPLALEFALEESLGKPLHRATVATQ
jgi:hypothetical protein